jgi:hypothetical protein
MKLNKTYLLFISLLFLTSMASKVQVDGVQASIQKEKSQQIHKTESADYGFMDFLFEEDTTENEDDNLFTPFTLNPVSSLLFTVNKSISCTLTGIPSKAFAFFKTPIFLTFRNIRL